MRSRTIATLVVLALAGSCYAATKSSDPPAAGTSAALYAAPTPTPSETFTATPKPTRTKTPKPKVRTPKPRPTPSKTRKPKPTLERGVHPGAFCSHVGALGTTVRGTLMRCSDKVGDIRARWRRA